MQMQNHMSAAWKRAAVAAAVVIASAALVLALFPAEGSEAAAVGGLSVDVYDQDSEDYGSLAYMNEKLPRSLEPEEWTLSDQGFWYGLSSGSSAGSILTYSETGASLSDIRGDIRARLGLGSSDGFAILQVMFTSSYGASATVSVEKDGVQMEISGSDRASVTVGGGIPLSTAMQHACIFTVGSSESCDIRTGSVSGTYSAEVESGGYSISAQTFFARDFVKVSGTVADASGSAIEGASVSYASAGGRTDTGTVSTASDGSFSFRVPKGSTVSLTSVSCSGYTFPYIPQPGTAISDTALPEVRASEKTLWVTVSDAGGVPAAGVEINAVWLIQNASSDDPSMYDKSAVSGMCSVISATDSSGRAGISYTVPKGDTVYLYVRAVSGSIYTFQANDGDGGILDGLPKTEGSPFPSSLLEGNVLWSPSSSAEIALTAVESSVSVSAESSNGRPLRDATVSAVWYYQTGSGSPYAITDDPSTISTAIAAGHAAAVGPTGAGGLTSVVYKVPSGLPSGCAAYLVISFAGFTAGSPRDVYSFSVADIKAADSSPSGIPDLASGKNGTAVLSGTFTGVALASDDAAYKCSGTLAGTMPQGASAAVSYGASQSSMADLIVPASDGTFSFYVKAGTSATVTWATVDGYAFSNDRFTTAAAFADFTYSSEVSAVPSSFERAVPSAIGAYTVSGLPSGAEALFAYTVSGAGHRASFTSDGGSLRFSILGWEGDAVTGLSVSSEGYYMSASGADYTAHAIVKKQIVTYASQGGALTRNNTVPNISLTVYCDGTQYAKVSTGSDGRATASLPLTAGLKYVYGDYTVTDRVSEASDPFDGFLSVNLYGLVDTETSVVVHARFMAVTAATEDQAPTSVDLIPVQEISAKTGSEIRLEAPDMTGFRFSGWMLDGSLVGTDAVCTLPVTADMDGKAVVAAYSAEPEDSGSGIDPAALAVGMLGVVIAVLALAFVLLQTRRV